MAIGIYGSSFFVNVLKELFPEHIFVRFEDQFLLQQAFEEGQAEAMLEEQTDKLKATLPTGAVFWPKPLSVLVLEKFWKSFKSHNIKPRIGGFIFDKARRQLLATSHTVFLREKEVEILGLLLESPCQVASKVDLLAQIWGYDHRFETRTLETHIYHLRQKIEENPEKPQILIKTDTGYALKTDVLKDNERL